MASEMPYLLNSVRSPNMSPSRKLLRFNSLKNAVRSVAWPLSPCSELMGTERGGGAAMEPPAASIPKSATHVARFPSQKLRRGIFRQPFAIRGIPRAQHHPSANTNENDSHLQVGQ